VTEQADPFDDTPEGEWRPAHKGRDRDDPRRNNTYRQLRKQFMYRCEAAGEPCALCGNPINYRQHYRSPWAPTVDHIIPVRQAPELVFDETNWQPAHRHCNESRARKDDDMAAEIGNPSEQW